MYGFKHFDKQALLRDSFRSRGVWVLVCSVLFWSVLLLVIYSKQKESAVNTLVESEESQLESFHSLLSWKTKNSILHATGVRSVLNDQLGSYDSTKKEDAERILMKVSSVLADFQKIRIINSDGDEVLKVEKLNGSEDFEVTPDSKLQKKGKRNYVKRGFDLNLDEIYISPLNLDIEHGKIVTPLKPNFRIVMPLDFGEGQDFGLLVFNNDLKDFITKAGLKGFRMITSQGLQIFWKSDNNHDVEFLVSDIPTEDPKLWGLVEDGNEQISSSGSGVVIVEKSDTSMLAEHTNHSELGYYLLSEVSSDAIRGAVGILGWRLFGLWLAITFLAIAAFMWIHSGIVAERNANERFLNQSEFLNTLLDSLPVAVFHRNLEGDEWNANPTFKGRFCGGVDLSVENCTKCRSKCSVCSLVFEKSTEFIETDKNFFEQSYSLDGDDGKCEIDLHLTKFLDSEGNLCGVLGAVIDVSHFKEHEIELEKAKDSAERANNAKGAFLATMSHEIRTPLNGIIGMTSLMADTKLSEIQNEYVDTIRASGETLLNLINDILDFSKIEADKIELEQISFNIEQVVHETLDLMSKQTNLDELELVYRVEQGAQVQIVGDMIRVKQVLLNLVGNAIKFTPLGSVLVEIKPDKQNKDKILVSVVDSGIGIQKDRLEHLFDPFVQEDSSTTRQFGGTGLGLAICKRLVNAMGGELTVESEVRTGSIFTFSLPVGRVPEGKMVDNSQVRILRDLSALIVDDKSVGLRILKEMLEDWRMDVHSFSDPNIALDWLKAGNHCDVVICDHLMQAMDGETFGKNCSEHLDTVNLQTPIVLLSSLGGDYDNDVFAKMIPKPLLRERILDVLIEVMSRQEMGIPRMVSKRSDGPKLTFAEKYPLKILVAEDNKVNQRVVKLLLKKMGYVADFYENGKLAFDAYSEVYHDQPYDVILMDIQMPILDGIQAGRKIRELEQDSEHDCCIVALTANVLDETREAAVAAGFNDYLCKPVKVDTLKHSLEKSWIYLNRMTPERKESARKEFFTT